MIRAWPANAVLVAGLLASTGCDRPAVAPGGDLPPAYTRDKILDPKLAEVARAFTTWAGEQKLQAGAVFSRVEVLPPALHPDVQDAFCLRFEVQRNPDAAFFGLAL